MNPSFPLRAASALFLERQWLDKPRGRRLSARTLAGFAGATGGIQLDSINVVERAHHLTLWSRFGPYRRESLRKLIEQDRVLFEYWAHVACLVTTADFPAWRRVMLDYKRRHKGWARFLKKHQPLIAQVEATIRERGPLGNADFREPGKKVQSGWWNWRPATHALDYLFMSGRTSVHSRVHFHKRFDLMERVVPPAVLAQEPMSAAAFRRWHLDRSLRAMGAATETDLRMYLTYPRFTTSERKAALRDAIRDGSVVEFELSGERGKWYARREDLDALASAGRRRTPSSGSALLAPFDSFLWHRERTRRLFGFDYRIEVYVPGPKRTHGYYTLPVLVDGRLIGRADIKTHRVEGVLELRNVHFEPWFVAGEPSPVEPHRPLDRARGLAGLAEAVHSLATFAGCSKVKLVRTSPAGLRTAVRRALEDAAPSSSGEPAEAVSGTKFPPVP
jgi:uncharacterized protein YcaQ